MGMRLVMNRVPVFKELSEAEKSRIITDFTIEVSKQALTVFKMLDLKTHIECMVINDFDGKEYILSFKTVERHMEDRAKKVE